MTIEAEKTAASENSISYSYFAEQIDPETKVPVGMAPLEKVFESGLIKLPEFSVWHDVGAGVFSSTSYIISKLPEKERSKMILYASDPNFGTHALCHLEDINNQVGGTKVVPLDANNAVKRIQGCDLITMINMVHNVPDYKRTSLMLDSFNSLKKDGCLLLSTSFYEGWNVNRETMYFQALWQRARLNEAKNRGIEVADSDFNMWKAQDYRNAIMEPGFKIEYESIETMPCTVKSYELISHDEEWLGNTMPGVDLEVAAEISVNALISVVKEKNWDENHPLPRNTLVIVAKKTIDSKATVYGSNLAV